MSQKVFEQTIAAITDRLAGKSLDTSLQSFLNAEFGPDGETFGALADLCEEGIADGWLCNREHGGIKFGRIVKPGPGTHGFSVDVVEMEDVVGPHHRHPTGEIDMIIPRSTGAEFDGHGRGWLVYGPDSAHSPTVTGGKAIVLYLLPDGAIEFTPADF